MSTQFIKAKKLAIKVIQKRIDRSLAREGSSYGLSRWDKDQMEKVTALTDYPTNSIQLRDVDTVAKAKLLKAQLQEKFPDRKFSVLTDNYSGGSSIDAEYIGEPIPKADLDKIAQLYSDSGKTDLQTDYFDYDNYCHVKENYTQYSERSKSFPECSFCGMKQEKMAVTCNDKNACTICRSNGNAGTSFKSIPETVVN